MEIYWNRVKYIYGIIYLKSLIETQVAILKNEKHIAYYIDDSISGSMT